MARNSYEGSPADRRQDARGAKQMGVSLKDYENTPRDRREDAAGERAMRKADHHPHHAGHRHAGYKVGENAKRSGPQPGQTEFSAAEEKAMRNGAPSNAAPQVGSSQSDMTSPGVLPDTSNAPDNDQDDFSGADASGNPNAPMPDDEM